MDERNDWPVAGRRRHRRSTIDCRTVGDYRAAVTAGLSYGGHRLFEGLGSAPGTNDVHASLGEQLGAGPADAGAGTGDNRGVRVGHEALSNTLPTKF